MTSRGYVIIKRFSITFSLFFYKSLMTPSLGLHKWFSQPLRCAEFSQLSLNHFLSFYFQLSELLSEKNLLFQLATFTKKLLLVSSVTQPFRIEGSLLYNEITVCFILTLIRSFVFEMKRQCVKY